MPHAFDVRIHDRVAPRVGGRVRRVAFVGNPSRAHTERVEFLDALSREVEIDGFGSGADLFRRDSPLRSRVEAPVWGADLYRVYGSYGLAFRNIGEAAGTLRIRQASIRGHRHGSSHDRQGRPLASERLFDPASEIVTYDSVASCAETITHLLADEVAATCRGRVGMCNGLIIILTKSRVGSPMTRPCLIRAKDDRRARVIRAKSRRPPRSTA